MNKELLLDDDQESNYSFDSSQYCSLLSRTGSMDSTLAVQKIQQILKTPSCKGRAIDQVQTEKTISIQKPRIQHHSQNVFFQHSPQFQLGFVKGKNKTNVLFNESKMKKVSNFFDDDQTTFNQDLFPNHSLFEFPKTKPEEQIKEDIPQFSIPCFKNMGKKNKIEIDQNLLEKAKNFFNDDIQDGGLPSFKKPSKERDSTQLSFRKPTKVKKVFEDQTKNEQNFIKTVNVNKIKKREETKIIVKKQVFDWNRFQISSKKLFSKEASCRKSSTKKLCHSKRKSKNGQFKAISLGDLDVKQMQDKAKISIFQQRRCQFQTLTFIHNNSECKVIKCLLCDLKVGQSLIDISILQEIFNNKLILQKINSQKFRTLYNQICFKLLKYETFYPEIVNKTLNPSNILVEMHKKSKIIESGSPCLGWLDFCLKQSKFYHSFIGQVKQIYHNQKIKTHFIQISDGWTNVWAIVTEKNYLYKFVHKLKIFSKIFIGYWKFYSLANILNFCPCAKIGQKCIEIWYNSTVIVRENLKIGKPKSTIFYRPLNLNRKEGGIVPTVEGTIIRMFCPSYSKKKSFYESTQSSFNQNYVQIITPEKYTVLIKFILPSDRCLAELFRLYFKYHFYFLKIGTKDSILQFNDDCSKFYEFEKKQKNAYEFELIEVLKARYINSMSSINLLNKLKIGKFYDIRLEGAQGFLGGVKFIIQNNNQTETTNSFIKGGAFLYQQYELDRIQKLKNLNQNQRNTVEIYLRKSKFSNMLKSLPAVYQKLSQY